MVSMTTAATGAFWAALKVDSLDKSVLLTIL